jgi:hypothetical protein
MPKSQFELRKLYQFLEVVHREGGQEVAPPTRVAATAAVVTNFLAGSWAEDLSPLVEAYCTRLGTLLSEESAAILGAPVEAFGKGALVGIDGEIEHGSAILHNLRFGNPVRARAGGARSLLPSAEKRGGPGATLDIPLKHVNDATIRSHHQTFEVRIPDAPRADELVIVVALSSSGRPLARLSAFGTDFSAAEAEAP